MHAALRDCTMMPTVGLVLLVSCCSADRLDARAPSIRPCGSLLTGEAHKTLLNRENVEAVEPLAKQPLVLRPTPLKTAAAEQKARTIGVRIPDASGFRLDGRTAATPRHLDSMNVDPSAHDPNCPFALKGTSVTVRSTGTGFAVEVELRIRQWSRNCFAGSRRSRARIARVLILPRQ